MRQALASVQSGWISATTVRTITLLGKRDPGAGKAFGLLVLFSTLLVAVGCVPMLIWPRAISSAMTNDAEVCCLTHSRPHVLAANLHQFTLLHSKKY